MWLSRVKASKGDAYVDMITHEHTQPDTWDREAALPGIFCDKEEAKKCNKHFLSALVRCTLCRRSYHRMPLDPAMELGCTCSAVVAAMRRVTYVFSATWSRLIDTRESTNAAACGPMLPCGTRSGERMPSACVCCGGAGERRRGACSAPDIA